MKVIFLDFDGVLHTHADAKENEFNKIHLLERLVRETGAKIVVSSDWRFSWPPEDIKSHLLPTLSDYIIGETICDITPSRAYEIYSWLLDNDVDRFVILDDIEVCSRTNDEYGLIKNFVRTNPETALTDEDVDKAIQILRS